MKRVSALLLLLLAACASPTAVMDKRAIRCGPGQDIEVRAGIDDGTIINREDHGEMKYLVEVSNNSHADVTVKAAYYAAIAPHNPATKMIGAVYS